MSAPRQSFCWQSNFNELFVSQNESPFVWLLHLFSIQNTYIWLIAFKWVRYLFYPTKYVLYSISEWRAWNMRNLCFIHIQSFSSTWCHARHNRNTSFSRNRYIAFVLFYLIKNENWNRKQTPWARKKVINEFSTEKCFRCSQFHFSAGSPSSFFTEYRLPILN